VRRATDVLLLVASVFVLVGVIASQPPGRTERSFLRFLQTFPSWVEPVWAILPPIWGWFALTWLRRRQYL